MNDTGAPIKPILTLRKVKTAVPSLKVGVDKVITSNVVYQFECSHCSMSYVGMTSRHLKSRISEHLNKGENKGPIVIHSETCLSSNPTAQNFKILKKVQKNNIVYLSVMEALFIREINPSLNTKDEFKGRRLRIQI